MPGRLSHLMERLGDHILRHGWVDPVTGGMSAAELRELVVAAELDRLPDTPASLVTAGTRSPRGGHLPR